MKTLTVLGMKHTFALLRGLSANSFDGTAVAFNDLHAATGCSGKMLMSTLRRCVAMGWAASAGQRAGWRLTLEGEAVLRIAEQLVARDGEPADERFAGRPADPSAARLAKARAALERGPVKVTHRGVPDIDQRDYMDPADIFELGPEADE